MRTQVTLIEGIYGSASRVFASLVPPPEHREPFSTRSFPIAIISPSVPFLLLAYLSRRADTHLTRLLLLPVAVTSALYFTLHYKIEDARYGIFEFIRFLVGYYILGKSLNFAFVREGRFKTGERRLQRVNEVSASSGILPPSLNDALELAFAVRGIGWDFGRDVYVPPRTKSTQRGRFLRDATVACIKNFLIVDLCDSLIKLAPGVDSLEDGSMFLQDLPLHWRYSLSTAVYVLGGMLIIFGLEAGSDFVSLLAVGLLRSSPDAWFPLYDSPWRSTSLHHFWGKGWHQLLRHVFLSCGGYAGGWLAGQAGLVLGTFLASGLYHELGMQLLDHRIMLFFVLQGIGILLENVYKRYTGKRVGGVMGWCWTAFWVIILGQMCTARAIGRLPGAILIPRKLSIVRGLVFPGIRYLIESIVSR
ncbi:uncharacterized protein C8Q71DRAFT_857686 [Rhodofomes roseus]|uniref:Wax synthase domain-containing protein n=1 Tax=Rhodofomes roseus TaxID=34475 RepID=A0ABQ8KIS0_9APHY|nr:uncharacterized protein C8Q71DRAFT_857686 [Rhodofomes roseus]KAH9837386.1 hypothetical protein C8Q71DRAFT_857686 [Rhodofomes roseus]